MPNKHERKPFRLSEPPWDFLKTKNVSQPLCLLHLLCASVPISLPFSFHLHLGSTLVDRLFSQFASLFSFACVPFLFCFSSQACLLNCASLDFSKLTWSPSILSCLHAASFSFSESIWNVLCMEGQVFIDKCAVDTVDTVFQECARLVSILPSQSSLRRRGTASTEGWFAGAQRICFLWRLKADKHAPSQVFSKLFAPTLTVPGHLDQELAGKTVESHLWQGLASRMSRTCSVTCTKACENLPQQSLEPLEPGLNHTLQSL